VGKRALTARDDEYSKLAGVDVLLAYARDDGRYGLWAFNHTSREAARINRDKRRFSR